MKNIIILIICAVCILSAQTAEQIKQAKEVIKKTGMSEAEARAAAKGQGYTDKQIDAAIQKEKGAKTTTAQITSESADKVGLPDLGKSNEVEHVKPVLETIEPVLETIEPMVGKELSIMGEDDLQIIGDKDLEIVNETGLNIESASPPALGTLTYFGYDIFKRDPALFQASSVGAVDPDYLIGPGDEIIVMLWGETQFRQVLTVDREGFVFIPEIGQVFVNGLNLSLLESKLFRVLSQSYASLNPQGLKPTTFLDVSLGNLRPLRIQVLGDVAQPGAYTVSPSATLFSALYYFNGPTTSGCLRDIRLIRAGKEIASIDFYDYLLSGKKPKDQKLQLDDVVFIPHRLKTVTIEGEINRPGIYELKLDETLTDIIEMSGGLKITAYLDRAQIDRIVPFDKRAELGMDRMFTDVNLEQVLKAKEGFSLQDGDRIQVFSVLDLRQSVVDLRGAVTRPGSYDLGESLSLGELINKANGLLGDAYLERIDVVRIKPDFTEELIKLDLEKALAGNADHNIQLQGLDRVRVYGMTEMVPRTYVSITGHVKRPGRFLLQENMTLYDLIFKAGGFVDEEYKKRTYLERAELVRVREDSDEKEIIPFNLGLVLNKQGLANTTLRTDDAVRIYSVNEIEGETRYVSILGHVKRPGRYELFEGNMTLYDLIFKAGGFVDEEYKKRTYLERAELVRVREDSDEKEIIPFNLGLVLNKQGLANTTLRTDDAVQIYSVIEIEGETRYVSITGHVKRPGKYELYEGNMTLYDLIFKAGGFVDEEYKKRTYLERAELVRVNEDNDEKEIIPFNLGLVLTRQGQASEHLRTDDAVRIYSVNEIEGETRYVSILGHVKRPGRYELFEGNMTLYDLIFKAGGFVDEEYKKRTYLERAELVRVREDSDEKEIIPFNLGSVLDKQGIANTALRTDDAVQIYSVKDIEGGTRYVSITGHVKRPGKYELYEGNMTLYDLIFKAGGFKDPSYKALAFLKRADLIRLDSNKVTKSIIPFNLDQVLNNKASEMNFMLNEDDEIRIYSNAIFNQVRAITLSGSVRAPGTYILKTGMTIKDLILEGGGVSENVHKYKIEVARIDPEKVDDSSYAETIEVDMFRDYSIADLKYQIGSSAVSVNRDEFELKPYDYVTVRPDPYFRMQRMVIITGAVYYPGDYVVQNPNETISDVLERAGGLRPNAYPIASTFTRQDQMVQIDIEAILNKPHSRADVKLLSGDQIFVATRPTITQILGEVSSPGFYKYIAGKRINDYIDLAGGFSQDAEKKDIWIRYPNGKSKQYNRWWSNPRVLDGSVITVGKKKEVEPFDRTEFATEMASIMTDFAQLALIITAINQ